MAYVKTFIILCFLLAGIGKASAVCVDYDGDGGCDATGSVGGVPMPSAPSAASSTYVSGTQSADSTTKIKSSSKARVPSSTSSMSNVVSTTVTSTVVGSLFNILMSDGPSGPSPDEVAAQKKLEEQKRFEFQRSNASLSGKLKGGAQPSYVQDSSSLESGGLQLKQIPSSANGDVHADLFGQPGALDGKKVELLREPVLTDKDASDPLAWKKIVSNPDLTQEERDHLMLKSKVGSTVLDDHPMIDSRAFTQKERWTDPYLDVAGAAGKGAVQGVAGASVEDAGKHVLERVGGGTSAGFDELLTAGKVGTSSDTAQNVIAVGDYALTKAPGWGAVAEGAVGAVGGGARQAVVRYWASRDSQQMYDPTPVATAEDKWNTWVSDQNDWTRAALDRVGAGEFEK